MGFQVRLIVCVALLTVALAAGGPVRGAAQGVTVKVGSKDFTEEFLLAEMYSLLLEGAGFKVERKFNLGGTPVAHVALLRGDIDLYPEYTSTALLTVLKEKPLYDPKKVWASVSKAYKEKYNLVWLEPAAFNDTDALATTREVSQRYGLKTYSDLAAKAAQLRLGAPAEFAEREDGIKGLQKAYGGFKFKDFKQLGTGSLRYQALQGGQVDVIVVFSTEGQIKGYNLVLLDDNKRFYPPYQAAPVARADALRRRPKIAGALNRLAPFLTTYVMSSLNWKVDGPEKKEYQAVARTFLQDKNLVKR
jgi:osmoprotectant transport system substrate-binding protein